MKTSRFLIIGLVLLLAALVGVVCIMAWVPPVSRDALTHHLAVPKLYIEHGRMVELPYLGFSYFPMNLDLLYLVPLYFGNDILPKYIHFAFGLLTAGLIFRYLKRRLSISWALLGALMFLSIPVVVKLSITVYVDLGLVFFTTAALMYLIKWNAENLRIRYLATAAVFCGLALGTKYNGLVALVLLAIFVPILFLRSGVESRTSQLKAVGWSAAFVGIALLVFSPWMVRNLIWTGNPLFPLYKGVFRSAQAAPSSSLPNELQEEIDKRTEDWNHFAVRRLIYKESWGDIALTPLRIFFQGRDDDPRYFDGKLNPFLLIFPIFAFFPRRPAQPHAQTEKRLLLAFAVLFILFAFLKTSIRIRYVAPAIPPLVILSIYGLHNLVAFFREGKRPAVGRSGPALVTGAVLLMLSLNAVYMQQLFRSVDPLSFISGKVSRGAYIERFRPEYPVMQYANEHLQTSDKIMGLFLGNRRYYCDRKLVFGENYLTRSVILAQTPEQIRQTFVDHGFTHIIVHLELLQQWSNRLKEPEQGINAAFFNTCLNLLARNGSYALFAIKKPPG